MKEQPRAWSAQGAPLLLMLAPSKRANAPQALTNLTKVGLAASPATPQHIKPSRVQQSALPAQLVSTLHEAQQSATNVPETIIGHVQTPPQKIAICAAPSGESAATRIRPSPRSGCREASGATQRRQLRRIVANHSTNGALAWVE